MRRKWLTWIAEVARAVELAHALPARPLAKPTPCAGAGFLAVGWRPVRLDRASDIALLADTIRGAA